MQGIEEGEENPLKLQLNSSSTLAIDTEESTEERIKRLISENPAIILSRSSCCMCHVMKTLLHTIGVHPTVIHLDEHEISQTLGILTETPAFFVAGTRVGGLETLVGLHLSNRLVPLLVDAGALDVSLWV